MAEANVDPHHLLRFEQAQSGVIGNALAELQAGEKRTHWMWFIFPQLIGLGTSAMAERFAIRSRAEAQAYLAHPVLGLRLRHCAEALLAVPGRTAGEILGYPDCLKLRSSMTLFADVSDEGSVFHRVLDRYFEGEGDGFTLAILRERHPGASTGERTKGLE